MIGFLADYPETIPTLVRWFRDQWPGYFADQSDAEMEQDFLSEAARNRIPSRLVAIQSSELVGTIVLRGYAADFLPEFQPGLGGLFVPEAHRRCGIGTELIRSGMELAAAQGHETVYATTRAAAGILGRLGWEFIKTVVHDDERLGLYGCNL